MLRAHSAFTYLLLLLLAACGSGLVLYATARYGAGVSPDSVNYIATARNIVAGLGVVSYQQTAFVLQPPLLPLVLAGIGLVGGADPLAGAAAINALVFGGTILAAGALGLCVCACSRMVAVVLALLVLLAWPLLDVAVMVWSEPLFVLLIVLALLTANWYLQRPTWGALGIFAAVVALCPFVRYIGLLVILWGGLVIFLSWGKATWARTLRQLALFLFITLTPIGLWLLRNYLAAGTTTGTRAPSLLSLTQNLELLANTLLRWSLPLASAAPTWLGWLLLVGIGLFLGALIVGLAGRWRQSFPALDTLAPALLFVILYSVLLVASATLAASDPIGNRLLAPVHVPLALLGLCAAAWGGAQIRRRMARSRASGHALAIVGLLLIGLWVLLRTGSVLEQVQRWHTVGAGGYNTQAWQESALVAYLRSHDLASECTLTSNVPDALYYFTGQRSLLTPAKTAYNAHTQVAPLQELRNHWPAVTPLCVVWFDRVQRDFLYARSELAAAALMTELARFEDGGVYLVP